MRITTDGGGGLHVTQIYFAQNLILIMFQLQKKKKKKKNNGCLPLSASQSCTHAAHGHYEMLARPWGQCVPAPQEFLFVSGPECTCTSQVTVEFNRRHFFARKKKMKPGWRLKVNRALAPKEA